MVSSKDYWTLFKSTFLLSAFTFGGGYIIVPLMQETFVDKLHWIHEDEMLDLVAIGQTAPGPIAVNSSILVGYQKAGIMGALISTLGTVIPPLAIMTIVSYIYLMIRDNQIVNNILVGMSAGVAAIIVNVVYNMAKHIFETKNYIQIAVMIISLIAGIIFQVNIIFILLFAGIVGFITTLLNRKGGK